MSTDRQIGMGIGPIPASSIRDFGKAAGLDVDSQEILRVVMREMDLVYLEHVTEEDEARRKANAPPPKK